MSDLVFIHMENVESAIGSTEQNVEEVAIEFISDKMNSRGHLNLFCSWLEDATSGEHD